MARKLLKRRYADPATMAPKVQEVLKIMVAVVVQHIPKDIGSMWSMCRDLFNPEQLYYVL